MDSRFGFRLSSDDMVGGGCNCNPFLESVSADLALRFMVPAVGREQRSESSLSLGERLCMVFFPFVAITEAVFFALTDCLAVLCPGSDSSAASRRYGAAASSAAATFLPAKNKSYHRRHHYRPMLRRGGWTSLDLHQLARLAADSRCCKNPIFPHSLLAGWFVRHFLAMPFDLTPSCAHLIEPSLGERGGGAL